MTMREGDGLFPANQRVMRPKDYSAQQSILLVLSTPNIYLNYDDTIIDFKIYNAC